MRFFSNRSIGFKIIAISALLAGGFLMVSFGYTIKKTEDALIESTLGTSKAEVFFDKNKIEFLANEAENTVLSLRGTPPFQGIIRARNNDGFDEPGNSTFEQWQNRLEEIFIAEMKASQIYDQLRYLDENGQELVRVDWINKTPMPKPSSELQNKGDRDYFIETKELFANEIYVSKTELNREGSPPMISKPYRPVVRYATPVFSDTDGSFKGIFIANVLVSELINRSGVLKKSQESNLYIANEDGYFIHHPNGGFEWGGPRDLNTGKNIYNEFPGLKTLSFENESGTQEKDEQLRSFAKIKMNPLDDDHEWIMLRVTPARTIFKPIDQIVKSAMIIAIITFIVLFFIFLFIVKYLLKPLEALTKGVEAITTGNFDTVLPIQSKDEIGKVASAFNRMASKLKESYSELEKQVDEKTNVLSNKVHELERTQRAVTNILEDIETEKAKFEAVLQSIGDGVFVVDRNLNIVIFNEVSAKLSGYKVEEAIGRPYQEILKFIHEEDQSTNDDFIKDVFETGEIQEMSNHTELVSKDGNHIAVSDSAAPLKDVDGHVVGAVIVFRDVSKERQIDRAKTEFVSLASHQLRTPLTSVNWYAEMLLSGDAGELNENQKNFVQEMFDGNQRMIDLVNSLLNVSRIELGTFAIEPEEVNLTELADSCINELKPMTTEKQIEIKSIYNPELKIYSGDRKLLRIIFQNLLSNAVKYSPEKSQIELTIDQNKPNNQLFIKVKDNGYGIPFSQQDKIFSKLFRADNVKKMDSSGTGLGLYIIKAIVETSNGSIGFESEENKGTTFHIDLPLSGMKPKEGSKPLE